MIQLTPPASDFTTSDATRRASGRAEQFWSRLQNAWKLSFENPPAAKALAEELAGESRAAGDERGTAHARLALASSLLRYSDYPRAEQLLDELDEQFARLGDEHATVVADAVRATLLYILGRSGEALERLKRTPQHVLDVLSPMNQFVYYNALAFAALANTSSKDDSLIEESIKAYARALSAARSMAMPLLVVRMTANIAVHQINAGAVDEAIRMAAEARTLVGEQAEPDLVLLCLLATVTIMCRIELGEDHDLDGDVAILQTFLDAGYDGWRLTNIIGPFLLAGTLLLIRRGDLLRGKTWLDRCVRELSSCPAQDIQLRLAWARGEWHLAVKEPTEAAAIMLKAWDHVTGAPPYLYQLSLRIADAYALMENLPESVRWYQLHIGAAKRRARLASRVSFGLLESREQLIQAERDRDYARLKHEHAERTQQETEQFNIALRQKMEQIEDLQIQLRERSIRDALTGLFNRRHLNEVLPTQIEIALASGTPMAIAMIDLDNFKQINDSWGHAMGDAVLSTLGRSLRELMAEPAMAFRFGGEEFFCMLPGTSIGDAASKIERLLGAFRAQGFTADGSTLRRRTFSAGVTALLPGDDAERLIARADTALYRAKQSGRDRIEVALG